MEYGEEMMHFCGSVNYNLSKMHIPHEVSHDKVDETPSWLRNTEIMGDGYSNKD